MEHHRNAVYLKMNADCTWKLPLFKMKAKIEKIKNFDPIKMHFAYFYDVRTFFRNYDLTRKKIVQTVEWNVKNC